MKVIPPSGTISVMEKARQMIAAGRNVLRLDIGDPLFHTPEHIQSAAYAAMQKGRTRYTSTRGILELRDAIASDLTTRSIHVDPRNEIIVTPGSKHALFCACFALLNPGDDVIVLSPSWPTHFVIIKATGARPIEVPRRTDFRVDLEELKNAITKRTRMILIHSPNNPTGGVLERAEITAIAEIADDAGLFVLSDEVYDKLVYDGFTPTSIAALDHMRDRTITVNSFSKTYAMTGWRLGYAVANPEIIAAMARIQGNTTTCPATFVQYAGIAALKGPQDCVKDMVHEYDARRKLLVTQLNKIDGISCVNPKGAFYAFPDVTSIGKPSDVIVTELLEKVGVSSTAGSVFGSAGEGHIRLTYAMSSKPAITEAMERLRKYMKTETG